MRALDLPLDVLAEVGPLAAEAEQVLVLGVVEHLDGVALEDVLELVVLEHVVGLPALLVDQPEAIDRVYLDALGDVHPLLHDVLAHLLALVVRLQVVEIDQLVLLVVGEAQHLVVCQVVGQTETVQKDEVDVLGGLVHVLEGVVDQRADGGVREAFQEVVEELVERAEEVGVLAEEQVQVLLELDALLGLYAGVEEDLEQQDLVPLLSDLPHLYEPLVDSVDEPGEGVEMLRAVEGDLLLRLGRQVGVFRHFVVEEAHSLALRLRFLNGTKQGNFLLLGQPGLEVDLFVRCIGDLVVELLFVEVVV